MPTNSICPSFLVAGPSLKCPFFHHAVVLLTEHNEEGSFGFVVNKPADLKIKDIAREIGLDAWRAPDFPVLYGGPVAPESGWVLYEDRDRIVAEGARGVLIDDAIAFSSSIDLLKNIGSGRYDVRGSMMLGYAGWSVGQLESEMRDGSWIPVDLDYELLFNTPLDQRWQLAFAKLGIDPARVVDHSVARA